MRNPFRRQTETPAPTLRERAADLSARLRPAGAVPVALPASGSAEAKVAWLAACHEHSVRSAPLHDCPDLMTPTGGVWTKDALGKALETGGITVAEYARLYPLASERELRFDQIGHDLNIAPLFALAHAGEYERRPAEADTAGTCADLTATILDGWAAWNATLDGLGDDYSDEEAAAALAPMNRLARAAADLPATAENIAAKAIAHAWREWVSTERPGQPRDAYDLDGQLVYDLHAAIVARGVTRKAAEPRPLDLIAAAGVSLEAMTLRDLIALHGAARLLGDVASAVTCQPRSMTGDHFNGAGLLVEQLGEALSGVIEAAAREIQGRDPADWIERQQRLAALSETAINNDDPAETAAFAREVLAMVEK